MHRIHFEGLLLVAGSWMVTLYGITAKDMVTIFQMTLSIGVSGAALYYYYLMIRKIKRDKQ